METEGGHPTVRQEALAVGRSAERMGPVLDQDESFFAAYLVKGITVSCETSVIDRHNSFRACGQALANLFGIDVKGPSIDVRENRSRDLVSNRVHGRKTGEGGH